MKIIKPLNLSLLNRVTEERRCLNLVSSVISFFSFQPGESLLNEVELWGFLAEELGEETAFDSGMPKPRGEVLITGSFYAPNGQAVKAGKVKVQLANLNKELYIYGDRYWQKQGADSWTLSDPEEIKELQITYNNSYGGQEYPKNPLGKGYLKDIESIERGTRYPVPNIIDPNEPFTEPLKQTEPAGFGPYDLIWPQRFSKVGTYDQQWLKELFPGFAKDIDHTIFNSAPVDQQFNGFFNGCEDFVCENMHPDKPILRSNLPGVRPRCFLQQDSNGKSVFREVPLQLDTIWLFPHAEKGIIIHRGQTEVQDDQAADITEMLVAYEKQADQARSVEHYQSALEKRLDPDKGHLYLLKDKDLIPEDEKSRYKDFIEQAIEAQEPSLLQKHALTKRKNDAINSKKEFEELGLDTGDTFDKILETSEPEPFPDIENLDILIESSMQEAAEKQEEMENSFREMTESMGLDYDQLVLEQKSKGGGRIEFSADEIIEQLQHFGSYSPEKAEQIRQTEQHFDGIYRKYGHFGPPATTPLKEKSEEMRESVYKAYSDGHSLAGKDLTGVDLSNLDLSGIDLHDAFMEKANLHQTILRGANLNHCMLSRANLTNCCCDSAEMEEINLGEADLSGASFVDCSMNKAILSKALLTKSQFQRADLREADLMECRGDDVNMQEANLDNGQFLEASFKGANFSKSNLNEALFLKCKLQKANLREARLTNAIFVESNGDGAIFTHADLTNLRTAMEVSFRTADFSNCLLADANLRGGDFHGANFTEANLSRADLSEAKLSSSRFYRAIATQAMFMKSNLCDANMVSINLFEGSLQQAKLINTDLRGANLFAADLIKVDFSQAQIEQANLGQTIMDNT